MPTQVYCQWREVSITTSKLWSNVDVRFDRWKSERADVEIVPIWFARFSAQPLEIVLRHPGMEA